MNEEQVRGIALFFFFTLMDDKVALQAAQKSVALLKASPVRRKPDDAASRVALIRTMKKVFEQHRKILPRSRPTTVPDGSWILPDNTDIGSWLRFQKDASDLEVAAVVLSQILSYSDQEIAEGLGISVGTARYRIGKGVRQLGQVVKARA